MYFWHNWLLNDCFKFSLHLISAFALSGESRPSIICVKMNEITSINSIYPNLWAGLLQGLTVMQQCVYQIRFRNVCEVKNIIDVAVNEFRKRLFACVRIVGQHFKQFYYRQLKNGQLDEMSAKVSKMWTKYVLRIMLIKQSYRIG